MDLIYMNSSKEDQGVMPDFELDLAFGVDENDFECLIASDAHCCQAGWFLYAEGTEYGGIIDTIEVRSEANEVVYMGRTWHGILGSKVVMPLTSSDKSTSYVTIKTSDAEGASLVDKYLVISGEAHKCIGFILTRLGLGDLFETPEESAGVVISNFQFDRFIDGYSGLVKMLSSVGYRMKIQYIKGKVVVSAVELHDFTTDEEFDPSLVDVQIEKHINSVNHLVCLGSGELDQRTVIHLYADAEGNISDTQTQFGMDEYAAVYDYSSVESADELLRQGTEKLRELWMQDEMVIRLDETSDFYDVGDKVGATDDITGVSVSAVIKKKIVKLTKDSANISYEVGE